MSSPTATVSSTTTGIHGETLPNHTEIQRPEKSTASLETAGGVRSVSADPLVSLNSIGDQVTQRVVNHALTPSNLSQKKSAQEGKSDRTYNFENLGEALKWTTDTLHTKIVEGTYTTSTDGKFVKVQSRLLQDQKNLQGLLESDLPLEFSILCRHTNRTTSSLAPRGWPGNDQRNGVRSTSYEHYTEIIYKSAPSTTRGSFESTNI